MSKALADDNHWHLDKRVPIALILALALQTVAIVWWAATMSQRVSEIERVITEQQILPAADRRITRLEQAILNLEQNQSRILDQQDRMDDKLDRIIEGRAD